MREPRQVDTHDFEGKSITWEGRSLHNGFLKRGFEGNGFGMAYHSEAPPC